jgi:hypothetical protein
MIDRNEHSMVIGPFSLPTAAYDGCVLGNGSFADYFRITGNPPVTVCVPRWCII